jgi:predicted nucleic acid-binding protein
MPVRTFVDSGVLIAAARGNHQLTKAAMSILDDPDRLFVSSDFVRLEVLPKAEYFRNLHEVEFYKAFLESAAEVVRASEGLVSDAYAEAAAAGLAAMDGLHVAAAKQASADELVTSERPDKPFFRTTAVLVRTIRPQGQR